MVNENLGICVGMRSMECERWGLSITFLRRWGRFTVSPANETNSTVFSSAKSLLSFTSTHSTITTHGKSNNLLLPAEKQPITKGTDTDTNTLHVHNNDASKICWGWKDAC